MRNRQAPAGILGFPVAPFDQQDQLDEQALNQNIEFLVKEGLNAIFISAGSGEFQSLTESEYQRMIEIAVSVVDGRVPVYAGIGGNIKIAAQWANIAEEKGADGVLVLPPYLIQGEQEGLFQYYKTLIEQTDLNIILYQRDNAIFTVETVQRLLDYPQVVGLKDGHGNMDLIIELTQTIGERLGWMNGMPFAEVTMPAYKPLGFQAYSSAISNYIPHISRLFYEALQQNNQSLLRDLYQNVMIPINQIRKKKKGYAVSLIKAGMDIVGLPVGAAVRAPLIPVEKEHYSQLAAVIKRALELYPR